MGPKRFRGELSKKVNHRESLRSAKHPGESVIVWGRVSMHARGLGIPDPQNLQSLRATFQFLRKI